MIDGFQEEEAEGIKVIGIERFRELLDSGAVVLDARTASEYEAEHIPGALLCDYYEIGRYIDCVTDNISPYEEFVIYCTGPDCEDSEMLARELYAMGYRKVLVFKGGIEEWIDSGMPVESGQKEQ